MTSTSTVTLPRGLWAEGKLHRDVEMQPFTTDDELALAEGTDKLLPVQLATEELARSLVRIGPFNPVSENLVRSLTVGDREALLLHLRRLTLGNDLQCMINCPIATCGGKMDLQMKVTDLLVPPYDNPQPLYDLSLSGKGKAYRVRFRVPNGADQEDAALNALRDPELAYARIMQLCVESCVADNGESISVLPRFVARQVSSRMGQLDPQAELKLKTKCSYCNQKFSAVFDTSMFFFQEIASRTRNLIKEVHRMALHYHWSESEILSLPFERRRNYLDLIDTGLDRSGRFR